MLVGLGCFLCQSFLYRSIDCRLLLASLFLFLYRPMSLVDLFSGLLVAEGRWHPSGPDEDLCGQAAEARHESDGVLVGKRLDVKDV